MPNGPNVLLESVAVVTGGAGAIGGAIAEALRRDGHRVVILDRVGDLACDLTDAAQVRSAAEAMPEDVAATVAFLARPEAAALTGQTITTDGGLVLR
jgi:NAD(P)-dependent dehydrogenase (short-subunit alcohol dehydrogenase family)